MSEKNNKKIIIKKKGGGGNNNGSVFSYIASVILVFLLLSSLYTFLSETNKKVESIPISQVSTDIKAGLVGSIVVEGDTLEIKYNDEVVKESKKEVGEALLQTFVNYGVTSEEVSKVKIEVKNKSL